MARGGNWTDSQVAAQFGDLKMGLSIKLGILIGGIALGVILLGLGVFFFFRYKK